MTVKTAITSAAVVAAKKERFMEHIILWLDEFGGISVSSNVLGW